VKVKFGIKASAMLSSLTLATAFVTGCTEETPEKPATTPPAAVGAPAKGGEAPAVPPATTPKAEEKK
jgi:hypothetical protein